jgi:hypothetical protein
MDISSIPRDLADEQTNGMFRSHSAVCVIAEFITFFSFLVAARFKPQQFSVSSLSNIDTSVCAQLRITANSRPSDGPGECPSDRCLDFRQGACFRDNPIEAGLRTKSRRGR